MAEDVKGFKDRQAHYLRLVSGLNGLLVGEEVGPAYQDVRLHCSDGTKHTNKLLVFLAFPWLNLPNQIIDDVFLPDYSFAEIFNRFNAFKESIGESATATLKHDPLFKEDPPREKNTRSRSNSRGATPSRSRSKPLVTPGSRPKSRTSTKPTQCSQIFTEPTQKSRTFTEPTQKSRTSTEPLQKSKESLESVQQPKESRPRGRAAAKLPAQDESGLQDEREQGKGRSRSSATKELKPRSRIPTEPSSRAEEHQPAHEESKLQEEREQGKGRLRSRATKELKPRSRKSTNRGSESMVAPEEPRLQHDMEQDLEGLSKTRPSSKPLSPNKSIENSKSCRLHFS